MRTIVREHSKEKLAHKVFKMAEQGWEPKTRITCDDKGFGNGTYSYFCVMEIASEKPSGKQKFNSPYGVIAK